MKENSRRIAATTVGKGHSLKAKSNHYSYHAKAVGSNLSQDRRQSRKPRRVNFELQRKEAKTFAQIITTLAKICQERINAVCLLHGS